MFKKIAFMLALASCFAVCHSAQASLTFTPGTGVALPLNNTFIPELGGLGLSRIFDGTLTASAAGTIEFYFHGQESGNQNSFTADSASSPAFTFTETLNHTQTEWDTHSFPSSIGSITVAAGELLDLRFSSIDGVHLIGSESFGIFTDAAGGVFAIDGDIYFGHDDIDSPFGDDDNHDDMIVSARFIPAVPEASTIVVWSVLGLIGCYNHGRRRLG